ncbi:hypothetical protein FQR65_LT05899 [Abscondita terminalis]|nr:hypothetical protein FQR65_LT05899 [Abscondita terminalis]
MAALSVLLLFFSGLVLNAKCSTLKMPSFAYAGDSVTIECNIDLGGLLATSIIFYKDNNEIYKFSREDGVGSSMSISSVPGVTLNMEKRDKPNEIELMNTNQRTSGVYSCKAKIDHTLMNQASLSGSLKIITRGGS